AHGVLYCHEGTHQGELFFLRQGRNRIASDSAADVVLTPKEGASGADFEALCDGAVELVGTAPNPYLLNGRAEYRASLVDYDELEICGNRFVYLAVGGES
ncbi:hypothetical protein K2X33_12365, partial [bacterium]|nr:hypothetical protein [bacterium]